MTLTAVLARLLLVIAVAVVLGVALIACVAVDSQPDALGLDATPALGLHVPDAIRI